MSGLNKRSKKKVLWQKMLIIIGIFYVATIIIVGLAIYNVPAIYESVSYNETVAVANEIDTALEQPTNEEIVASLTKVTDEVTSEIVVLNGSEVIYSTVPTTDFNIITEFINSDALRYHAAYEYDTNGETYQVWVAIYKTTPVLFMTIVMAITIGSVILLCFIMTMLIVVVFLQLLRPLQRLRDNIYKLKDYRLNEVHTTSKISDYDFLSEELEDFTDDLQGKLQSFNVNYTGLERELQARQEKSVYKERLISALVHDLKAPLNITLVQANKLEHVIEYEDDIQLLTSSSERVLNDINEIITVLNTDNVGDMLQPEHVEVVQIIRETMRLFTPLFKERKVQSYIDAPETIHAFISPIELKQIIHNVISNACQYADSGGVFELAVFAEDDNLIIEAYNDKTDTSQINFERVFDLFYHVDDREKNYGSGIGMYTIKSMVEQYAGTCTFATKEDGVVLTITLPLGVSAS